MDTAPPPFEIAKPEQTCFVYDAKTGYVLHVHQFCPLEPGGRCPEEEMERTALAHVSTQKERVKLAVLHHSGELKLKPGHRYRVDADRQTFVAEPQEGSDRVSNNHRLGSK